MQLFFLFLLSLSLAPIEGSYPAVAYRQFGTEQLGPLRGIGNAGFIHRCKIYISCMGLVDQYECYGYDCSMPYAVHWCVSTGVHDRGLLEFA